MYAGYLGERKRGFFDLWKKEETPVPAEKEKEKEKEKILGKLVK